MESGNVVNTQPELSGIIDETKSYMHEELWKMCAGPLCDLPKPGERVYYFPQGHIELVEASTRDKLNPLQPDFALPSKLQCRVITIKLKAEMNTDQVYAEITLMPDTTQFNETPSNQTRKPVVKSFKKVLSTSDTSIHGGFSVPIKHATECLPPLDMSKPVPTQELRAKDLHGNEWRFKHSFRGTPRRHLITTGWNAFVHTKKIVSGDVFVFLRGEAGELGVGIRHAGHQKGNIDSSLISVESMRHGVIAFAKQALDKQCMFTVVYKPSSRQFVVRYNKFLDAVNNKFNVGSRFTMPFERENLSARSWSGTIVGVNNFSSHWKDSEWRSLQVQWDEFASFARPDTVSPWEIEHVTPSPNVFQPSLLNNKRSKHVNETGSTSTNLLPPILTQGQEIGQPSMTSPMSVPQLSYRDTIEDARTPNRAISTMHQLNYNEDHISAPIKENIMSGAGGSSCRLFGVSLAVPSPMESTDLYQISETSKLSQEKKLGLTQTLTSPREIQSNQFSSTRSFTKVKMQGATVGRALDVSVLSGYEELISELENLFGLNGQLQTRNQWEIVFTDNEGDTMLVGDDPWPEFLYMVKSIFICSKEDLKNLKLGNNLSI